MADVYARRDNDRTRWEADPGDSLIATITTGTMWPPDCRVVCHWKGGANASPGRYDSRKAAASAAHLAWINAGYPKVIPPG